MFSLPPVLASRGHGTQSVLAGLLSVLIASVAHVAGGGAAPTSRDLLLLAVVGILIGVIRLAGLSQRDDAAPRRNRRDVLGLSVTLGLGQVAGHLTMLLAGAGAGGHAGHGSVAVAMPAAGHAHDHLMLTPAMIAAHLLAVPAAAALLLVIECLWRALAEQIDIALRGPAPSPILVGRRMVPVPVADWASTDVHALQAPRAPPVNG